MNMWILLQAVGITIVFVRGSIFRWLRESGPALWREGASCPLCAGVWIGAAWRALDLMYLRPAGTPGVEIFLDCLGFGSLVGTIALLAYFVIGVLDKYREK